MAFLYHELKRTGHIEKTYIKRWNNSVYFESINSELEGIKVYQLYDIFNLFPDHYFEKKKTLEEMNKIIPCNQVINYF